MMNINVPNYLTPVDALTSGVEVVGEVREKTDQEGHQRVSPAFGVMGWIVPVEVIRGQRTKSLPGGEEMAVLDTDTLNITVWSAAKPAARVGEYVALKAPMIGAVDGSIYVQALGVEPADDLDRLLEE